MEMSLMKKIFYIIIALAAAALSACQEPEALIPSESRNGLNSITASFPGDNREENEFQAEIDYDARVITIVFPYTYPANSASHLEKSDLTKVKLVASLDDNVVVEPPLLFMDLSRDDNEITVIDQRKERKVYKVLAEIRKSNLCEITKFRIPALNVDGVINQTTKVISVIYDSLIGEQVADITLSFGASFVGADPTVTAQSYDNPVDITVVAQDGVTQATYTVVADTPDILEQGMRPGSEKFLWKLNMNSLGIGNSLLTGGMAVIKDYVVLNTRNEDMVVLNAETGEKTGTIALDFKGSLSNFYCTGDLNDNILICNLVPNDGNVFTVYRIKGIDGVPAKYIEFDAGGAALGRKISVYGDLDGNAIITAPVYQGGREFYRWTVTGGVLNPTPDHVVIADTSIGAWTYNCDVVYSSATDVNADYFLASYAPMSFLEAPETRSHLWMDGGSHTIKSYSAGINQNWVPNAADYTLFNGVGFFLANSANAASWGQDDMVYLYDLSLGNLDEPVWRCEKGVYGSFPTNNVANGNSTADVALRVSDDGFFMYVYFMFSGGQMAKVQFDCINM